MKTFIFWCIIFIIGGVSLHNFAYNPSTPLKTKTCTLVSKELCIIKTSDGLQNINLEGIDVSKAELNSEIVYKTYTRDEFFWTRLFMIFGGCLLGFILCKLLQYGGGGSAGFLDF